MRAWLVALLLAPLFATPSLTFAQDAPVDLELVLAVDVSRSMDATEQKIQREGYIAAIKHPEVVAAIKSGMLGRIAVTYVEWAGPASQQIIVPWMAIDGLDSADMQRMAAWTNVIETTFVLPPTTPEASYRVRIFTPRRELAFAGHPSVGTAHAVLAAGLAVPRKAADGTRQLVQECGAGLLPVRVEGDGAYGREDQPDQERDEV